jgi:DNA-directed RNA polymerase subunit RPC12/RpoP
MAIMILDNSLVTVRCPKCKHQFREKFGRLKNSPDIPCPACAASIAVDGTQLAGTQQAVSKKLDDLRSVIKRINKR